MSSTNEQLRNRLIKKAKSNFWVWFNHFWELRGVPRVVSEVHKSSGVLRPEAKKALVAEWKEWVKDTAPHLVVCDRKPQRENHPLQ